MKSNWGWAYLRNIRDAAFKQALSDGLPLDECAAKANAFALAWLAAKEQRMQRRRDNNEVPHVE